MGAKQVDIDPAEFDKVAGARAVVIADRSNGRRLVFHELSPASPVKLTLAGLAAVAIAVWGAAWFVAGKLQALEGRTYDRWGGMHEAAAESVRQGLNDSATLSAHGYRGLSVEQIRGIQRSLKLDERDGI